jgi:hypothetical protein
MMSQVIDNPSRAFAGRLGGEEGLDQLVPDVLGYTDAIVPNLDLDRVAEVAGHEA